MDYFLLMKLAFHIAELIMVLAEILL